MRIIKFQSPCAGNMFGKLSSSTPRKDNPVFQFQSPCAGNMFGKHVAPAQGTGWPSYRSFNPRVRGTCLVRRERCALHKKRNDALVVSIPVCGEHVW